MSLSNEEIQIMLKYIGNSVDKVGIDELKEELGLLKDY